MPTLRFQGVDTMRVRFLGRLAVLLALLGLGWDGERTKAQTAQEKPFTVPAGFEVDLAFKNPTPPSPFSLINICFDAKGRPLVSQENGPVLLCTELLKDGEYRTVTPYCEQVKNCQGMCWVGDALLLVGDGPDGAGL